MKFLAHGPSEWPLHATISGRFVVNERIGLVFDDCSDYSFSELDLSVAGLSFSAWIQ